MATKAVGVLEEALKLTPQERAEIAARLIESLDSQADEDVESAWNAEIARRIQHVDSGSVRMIPWSEARPIITGAESQ